MLLKDKVVMVSGIGPGLGIKLALAAAREGAEVVLAARTANKLDAAETAIRDEGGRGGVLKWAADIRLPADCRALVDAALERFGRIDVLLNSAFSSGRLQPIATADLDDWRSTMETNLFGTLQLTQAVVPAMQAQGGGSIVMINSMVTRIPVPTQGGYAASKGALKTTASYLARELGPYRIRVNSVFMGWMWGAPVQEAIADMAKARGVAPEQIKREVESNMALDRMPTDAECADVVMLLASDRARVVTGACLDVNGGHFLP
jgi:NAD(P)-dependent dehydrogenase (short-subunit alcohol dehydrogenase family)